MTHSLLAILLVAVQASASYAGKPLGDVLRDLQRRGLNVVFSSELVKPQMMVASEPKATAPRRILDEVLAPHGLAVRSGPRGSFIVVRATPASDARVGPPTAAPRAATQTVEPLLSGIVIESDSRRPIVGATVAGGGKTASTNNDGRFGIRLAAGRTTVTVTASRFFSLITTVDLSQGDIADAEFALAVREGFASSVEVAAPAPAPSTSPSATSVAPAAVLKTAGSADNVFRTLQTLPGVAGANEFSSRLTVRGGAPDQNLTVMDGVEIHDPFRLFGLASAFNPELITHFELATAGFSARYGDRLSSLLLIENRDGDRSRRFGTSGSLSITDANLVFEGKLPGGATGSWLVTGRRTYYDLIVGRIIDDKLPQFADLQTKAVWEPAAGRKLTFFGLRSRQSADIDDNRLIEDDEHVQVDDDTRNDLASIRYDTPLGSNGHSTTVAGYSRTLSEFGLQAHTETGFIQRSNAPYKLSKPIMDVAFSRRIDVSDVSARQELTWSLGRHTIDAGGEVHGLRTSLRFHISGDRNFGEANGSNTLGTVLGAPPGAGLPDFLDSRLNSTRAGAWAIDTWRAGTLRLETGVRIDRTSITADTTLSPRLAASFAVHPKLSARATYGRYMQSPGYEKTAQSDYLLDFTADTTQSMKSERADIASLSVERTIGSGAIVRVETYYKRLTDLLIGRLETEGERLTRLAPYNFPASLASSLPAEPIVTTFPTNEGRGRAYGVDVLLSRMTTPLNARMRGWISYTWGKAELHAYGRRYPFDYDRRHAISAAMSYRASAKWELASTIRWATGFPRTAPLGVRVAGEERSTGNDTVIEPKRDAEGRPVYEVDFGGVSNLNNARLTNYARVDVRASWRPRGATGRWEYYVDVINLLNRKNSASFEAQLHYDPASDRPKISDEPGDRLAVVPTIGIRWRF